MKLSEFKIYCDRARAAGDEPPTLMIDNDDTHVYDPEEEDGPPIFEMHPAELLEQALDLLGIPHEGV
jgi:hypothetical protein